MIVRNGVRSVFRAKKLCVLFIILNAVLTCVLCLGTGIFSMASATLSAFEKTYLSVGRIEYADFSESAETAPDPYAREAYENFSPEDLSGTEGVISAQKKNFTLAYLEGFRRNRGEIPYKDYGVLILNSLSAMDEELTDTGIEAVPDYSGTCVITNLYTEAMRIIENGAVTDLRCFHFNSYDGKWHEMVYENGEFSENVFETEELPAEAVLSDRYGNKETVYSGTLDPSDRTVPHYQYDPEYDRYTVQEYKVTEYTAILSDALYSRKTERGILIRLYTGMLDFTPEAKHTYAVHGSYIDGGTSNYVFEAREFSDDSGFPILDITDMDRGTLAESIFGAYAEHYERANNYINVTAVSDLRLAEEFHQDRLILSEGRFPEAGEDNVCVIDRSLASQMNLHTGDTITLDLLKSSAENIYRFAGISETCDFEIAGITAENNDYQGEVFITRTEPFDTPFFGDQIGLVLFENENARTACQKTAELLGPQMRITLYDQGYEKSCEPVKALRSAALAVSFIAAAGCLSSLILFAFLYIYRQTETISTLYSLGLSPKGIRRWMISGVLCIVLTGALAGAFAGMVLDSFIASRSFAAASSLYARDIRYSEAGTGLIRAVSYERGSPLLSSLACVVFILIGAVLLSLFFLRLAMKADRPRKGYRKVKIPDAATDTGGRSVLRYGRIGFERGGSRSTAVILVTFALSMLVCIMAAIDTDRKDELRKLYENTEISGNIVSLDGKYTNNLAFSENIVRKFNRTGYLSSFHVAYDKERWWVKENEPLFANTSYGEETRAAWIGQQARLIFTDSTEAGQDFISSRADVTWREGYDESFFTAEYPKLRENAVFDAASNEMIYTMRVPALVPEGCFDEETYESGQLDLSTSLGRIHLDIAGTYVKTASKPAVYVPLTLIYDINRLTEEPEESRWGGMEFYFSAGRFTLKSAEDLSAFKDFLKENRYSQVNQPDYDRTAVLLYDGIFLDTLSTLERHIAFMRMICPVLMGFTLLCGFLISWLMINGRRMDFAVMKGLGASRFKVFMIFFAEQAYAALTGILPVFIVSFFISEPLWIVFFALSYLAGTALSIHLASRENLMALLSEKE